MPRARSAIATKKKHCDGFLEHFLSAFGLRGSRDLRSAAARALQLDLESITEDGCVRMEDARPLSNGADCDSDLEEVRDRNTSLQALTAEMREPEASFRQRDTRTPHSQKWDFLEGREGLTRFLFSLLLPIELFVKQMETLLQKKLLL